MKFSSSPSNYPKDKWFRSYLVVRLSEDHSSQHATLCAYLQLDKRGLRWSERDCGAGPAKFHYFRHALRHSGRKGQGNSLGKSLLGRHVLLRPTRTAGSTGKDLFWIWKYCESKYYEFKNRDWTPNLNRFFSFGSLDCLPSTRLKTRRSGTISSTRPIVRVYGLS